eukprot:3153600-Pyramimonas_sp.AAC.1
MRNKHVDCDFVSLGRESPRPPSDAPRLEYQDWNTWDPVRVLELKKNSLRTQGRPLERKKARANGRFRSPFKAT